MNGTRARCNDSAIDLRLALQNLARENLFNLVFR